MDMNATGAEVGREGNVTIHDRSDLNSHGHKLE